MDQGDQRLSEFMCNLNITLRNKLSVLLPALDLLEKRVSADPDDTSLRYLGEARRAAFSILRTAKNMADYGQYLANYDLAEPTRVELAGLFRGIVSETEKLAAYKPATIRLQCSEDPFYAYTDRQRVERLLYNLLSNAVLHGDGEVSVSLERAGDNLQITVRNNGQPIGETALSRLYDGYLTFAAPDWAEKNLGLGLPVALSIACQCGGTLMVSPDGANGTVVTASLPAAAQSPDGDDAGGMDTYTADQTFPIHLIELSDFPAYNRQYNTHLAAQKPAKRDAKQEVIPRG